MEQLHQEGAQLREVERFGRMTARYVYVARPAGHLAIGELVREPYLGPARVAGINGLEPDSPFIQVEWKDDFSLSTAAARYPADAILPVRVPAPEDWVVVQRGISRARYFKLEVGRDIARLIAAHLHQGPTSAVHRFARDGAIRDELFDELEAIRRRRLGYGQWANALARFVLSREDTYPMPEWQADSPIGPPSPYMAYESAVRPLANHRLPEQRAKKAVGVAAASRVKDNSASTKQQARLAADLDVETADGLIREAFVLGLQAAAKRALPELSGSCGSGSGGKPSDHSRNLLVNCAGGWCTEPACVLAVLGAMQ